MGFVTKLQKPLVLLFLFCLLPLGALAQNLIKGTVNDQSGEAIIGATVKVSGSQKGAITDLNGNFSIQAAPNATLTISFVGYETQRVNVNGRNQISIVLKEDSKLIDEVVVVGYGVQKKSDLTGAVASIKSDDIKGLSTTDAGAALQGKAAGVQIINSGGPGEAADIRIRGYSSNSGNIGPLLIVDGLKVDNIQYLDPSMIESMEVLKDAASAAIYGAQAGNGVVLITTKTGSAKKGEGHIFYNFQQAFTSLGKRPEVMNAAQFIDYKKAQNLITDDLLKSKGYDGTDTDWADVVFNTGLTQKHTLGFEGSTDRSNFYLAIENVNEDGPVVGDKDVYKRLSMQLNADYKINSWFKVGTNNSIEKWSSKSVREQTRFASVMMGLIVNDPLTPAYWNSYDELPDSYKLQYDNGRNLLRDSDGRFYASSIYAENDSGNPLAQRDLSDADNGGVNLRGVAFGDFTPIKGLVITSRFGYRISTGHNSSYQAPYYINGMTFSDNYSISGSNSYNIYYQWENFANYTKSFGKHTITAMAGMSFIDNYSWSTSGSASGPDPLQGYDPNFRYLSYVNSSKTTSKGIGGGSGESANMSYFGRIGWNYADRYNLQVNFRADAYDSSKLSKNNRWGYFTSFSAGWTISNENFFADHISKDAVSFLKLRGSWGQNGNVAVLGGYPYTSSISQNSMWYQRGDGITQSYGSMPSGLANPNLRWETSEQLDLGLDARFLNNRLTVGLDWYKKLTKDLLVSINPVAEVGIGSTTINAGKVENSGLELEMGWRDQIGDFSYSINGNLATLHNMVTYLDPSVTRINGTGTNYELVTAFEQGYPVWYMRGYKYLGVDEDGKGKYQDTNNDGALNNNDMVNVGCGIPDLTYGLTFNASYKNFDLSIFGTGTAGNEIYNYAFRNVRPDNTSREYFHKNAWSADNPGGTMPSALSQLSDIKFWASDACVFDGSFFKIKQIQLGYSFPEGILHKIAVSNLRLYVSLDDYFTFTKYIGMDPETASAGSQNSIGMDMGSFPTTKKVLFGINLTF